jgi:hypothetical protein
MNPTHKRVYTSFLKLTRSLYEKYPSCEAMNAFVAKRGVLLDGLADARFILGPNENGMYTLGTETAPLEEGGVPDIAIMLGPVKRAILPRSFGPPQHPLGLVGAAGQLDTAGLSSDGRTR